MVQLSLEFVLQQGPENPSAALLRRLLLLQGAALPLKSLQSIWTLHYPSGPNPPSAYDLSGYPLSTICSRVPCPDTPEEDALIPNLPLDPQLPSQLLGLITTVSVAAGKHVSYHEVLHVLQDLLGLRAFDELGLPEPQTIPPFSVSSNCVTCAYRPFNELRLPEPQTIPLLTQLKLRDLRVDAAVPFNELGLPEPQAIPLLTQIKLRDLRIDAAVSCYTTRPIQSLHELSQQICKSENVAWYSKLDMGPLLAHPRVVEHFKPDASLSVPPKVVGHFKPDASLSVPPKVEVSDVLFALQEVMLRERRGEGLGSEDTAKDSQPFRSAVFDELRQKLNMRLTDQGRGGTRDSTSGGPCHPVEGAPGVYYAPDLCVVLGDLSLYVAVQSGMDAGSS
eukprot:gene22837-30011_t